MQLCVAPMEYEAPVALAQFATAPRMWLCVLYVDPPAVPSVMVRVCVW